MKKKKTQSKAKAKPRTKAKAKVKTKAKVKASNLRQSKTPDFLEKLKKNNSMVDYFTRLTILNPPSAKLMSKDETRREGSFVRLAHAREEFSAPVIIGGKSSPKPTKGDK